MESHQIQNIVRTISRTTGDLARDVTSFIIFVTDDGRHKKLSVRQVNGCLCYSIECVSRDDTRCPFHYRGRGALISVSDAGQITFTTRKLSVDMFSIVNDDLRFSNDVSRYFSTDTMMVRNPRLKTRPVLYTTTLPCFGAPRIDSLRPGADIPPIVRVEAIPPEYIDAFECVRLTSTGELPDESTILVFHGPSGIGKSFIGHHLRTKYGFNVFETDSHPMFTSSDSMIEYVASTNPRIIVVGNRPGSETLDRIMTYLSPVENLTSVRLEYV